MKSENSKLWLRAVAWGMAGAFACTLVLPLVSYLIARICFSAALSNANFVDQLWFNPIGPIVGGVIGLALVLQKGPPVARSIAGGLSLWLGTCFTVLPLIFIGTITWRVLAGLPTPAQNMGDPLAFVWSIFFPTFLLGIIPLKIGLRLYSFAWEPATGSWGQGLKAVLWPNSANGLQSYTLSCPLSRDLVLERIRERAEIAQNPISRALLLPLRNKKGIIATIKRDALVLSNSKTNTGYVVRAEFAGGGEATLLKLQSTPQLMLKTQMVWFYVIPAFATVAALSSSIVRLITKGVYTELLQSLLFFPIVWYIITSIFRLTQFLGRQQEKKVTEWLVQNLEARIVSMEPASRKYILF